MVGMPSNCVPSGRAPCKGVDFQWVRIPPGNLVILAGSSSSGSGGNKRVGALNDKGSFSDSASVRAVTNVNAEQASKTGIAGADPPSLKGKAIAAAYRGMTQDLRRRSCRGKGDGTPQEEANATRETPVGDRCRSTGSPRGPGTAGRGVGKAHSTVEAG